MGECLERLLDFVVSKVFPWADFGESLERLLDLVVFKWSPRAGCVECLERFAHVWQNSPTRVGLSYFGVSWASWVASWAPLGGLLGTLLGPVAY